MTTHFWTSHLRHIAGCTDDETGKRLSSPHTTPRRPRSPAEPEDAILFLSSDNSRSVLRRAWAHSMYSSSGGRWMSTAPPGAWPLISCDVGSWSNEHKSACRPAERIRNTRRQRPDRTFEAQRRSACWQTSLMSRPDILKIGIIGGRSMNQFLPQ